MTKTTSYIFVDTNILLHFRPLREIAWATIVTSDNIKVVITRTVIRELDKIKNTHPSEKIRGRARRVLKEIEEWAKSKNYFEIQPKVFIIISSDLPTINFQEYHLDADWPDDCLIASAKGFKPPEAENTVYILSDDTGIRVKSYQLDLQTLQLDDASKLPDEIDPLELENERLKKEILKNSRPQLPLLKVEFADGQNYIKYPFPVLPNMDVVEQEIILKIEEVKKKYLPYQGEKLRGLANNFATGLGSFLVPSDDEINKYNNALPIFYASYEKYLHDKANLELRSFLSYEFSLQLNNDGHAPADDIDIYLHFPDGFAFVEGEGDDEEKIEEPTPPNYPRTAFQMMQDMPKYSFVPNHFAFPHNMLHNTRSIVTPSNVSSPKIRKTNSYDIEYTVKRLKHGLNVNLGSLVFYFHRLEDLKSFEADYTIIVANLPESVKGKLRFVLKNKAAT